MLEWLWEVAVIGKIQPFIEGRASLRDVAELLAPLALLILSIKWLSRKAGSGQLAAEWDKQMDATAELARKQKWHQVLDWHARYGPGRESASWMPKLPGVRTLLYGLLPISSLALLAWLTR